MQKVSLCIWKTQILQTRTELMSSGMNSRSCSRDIGKRMSFSGMPASAARPCPLVLAIRKLGARWTLLVLRTLTGGSRRFCEIRKEAPRIPAKSLVRVLSKLEKEGLIRRQVSSARPPHVSYSLTDHDPLLTEVLDALFRWGSKQALGKRA